MRIATFGVALLLFCSVGVSAVDPGPLIISEFRLRGPSGIDDEFVEIYNPGDSPHIVAAISGAGYALVASDEVARFIIPDGTVIPARGHYLGVNSVAYSLGAHSAGNGTTATGDATYVTEILDNAGIALFNTSLATDFKLENRLDAVGSSAEINTVYKEGPGYPALTDLSIEYSFSRSLCPSTLLCSGQPLDTGDNAADFVFVDTNGTSTDAGQRLGAPGPENASGPIRLIPSAAPSLAVSLVDPAADAFASPNHVRDQTSDPAGHSAFGTMAIRRKVTNNSGVSMTRLRFRVVDITTFGEPGSADLRPLTSSMTTVGWSTGGTATVQGTTREEPPSQPNGGGFNSTLSAETVTLQTPLAPGANINVQFLLGVEETGTFRLALVLESLPAASSDVVSVSGNTEDAPTFTPQLLISEFRLRGPNGINDEFVEIYNNTDVDVTVVAFDGSAGFALVGSNNVIRFTIPNGTVIPKRGHFLGVNSLGYSLAAYPAGNGTTATGDVTYTTEIPDNTGIALFRTANPANRLLANRLDAVGTISEGNTLYKEGTAHPPITPMNIEYSFFRKVPTSGAGEGVPQDTNNNASDFLFTDTEGTSAGHGQRLGAPGPENLSSPTTDGSALTHARLDPAKGDSDPPNVVRDRTNDRANNATYGSLSIRRTYTNSTGGDITRLRFHVVDLTTFRRLSAVADLRPRTSSATIVTLTDGSMVAVQGTTLETPPSQPNGGGFNSTLSADMVSVGTPLANGASIRVQFLVGLQELNCYRFAIVAESLPVGASKDVFLVSGGALMMTGLEAVALTESSVFVRWPAVDCAQTYEVFRSADSTSYSFVGSSVTSNFVDTTASPDTSYIYKVRWIDSAGSPSDFSRSDPATTIIFTDPTLTPESSVVKAVHITELRTAVNAMRTVAGLPVVSFTDPTLTIGVTKAHADHMLELRAALDPALAILGLAVPAYDNVIPTSTPIKAWHITQLRNRVK